MPTEGISMVRWYTSVLVNTLCQLRDVQSQFFCGKECELLPDFSMVLFIMTSVYVWLCTSPRGAWVQQVADIYLFISSTQLHQPLQNPCCSCLCYGSTKRLPVPFMNPQSGTEPRTCWLFSHVWGELLLWDAKCLLKDHFGGCHFLPSPLACADLQSPLLLTSTLTPLYQNTPPSTPA